MTAPKQRTIGSDAEFEGVGLHTGESARLRFRPAEPGAGLRFRRVDLEGGPEIPVDLTHVSSTDRGTTLGAGDTRVQTVEHLLAAAAALELDALVIETDGPEIPIGDGSFHPFFELLQGAGIRELDEAAPVLELDGPVNAQGPAGGSYSAVPASAYRVSASIEFDHPLIRRQYASLEVTGGAFGADIAPARTFGFMQEAEALRARGLAHGATLENAVVLDESGIAGGGELRFQDEFVRHKIGDVVGDLALLGRRLRLHVMADRPSHAGNLELARRLHAEAARRDGTGIVDIQKIMQYLPHRYPMLLVDRIVEFERGKRIVGLKNVTINEPFFQGHYPGHPVMPGVLVIEAMAQVGGLLLLDSVEDMSEKVIYFMSLDNVKWRRPVTPGDQILFELEVLALRRHVLRMRGVGRVDGKVVAEAEMMARIADR